MVRSRSLATQSSPSEYFNDARADYSAAKRSQYRRKRTGILPMGTHGDWHNRTEVRFLELREEARDFDRNDAVISSVVDRACTYTLQGGIRGDAKTPDKRLNKDLDDAMQGWAGSRDCSIEREFEFSEIERLTLRHTFVDGDVTALPKREGCLQMMEAHRLRTPGNTKRNVAFGILLDPDTRERLEYWFTTEDVAPMSGIERVADITPIPARDGDGNLNVFHVFDPKRFTISRGMTAFAPIFDTVGMIEDINFATMVKHQVAACFAVFREREIGFMPGQSSPTGPVYQPLGPIDAGRSIQGIAPGMDIEGQPGERLTGFSPNIPSPQFEPHLRLLLTILGINLGLPLVLVLMEPGGSFSAYRGAMDQAKIGFRRNQRWLVSRFHKPVREWKLRQFCADNPAFRAAAARMGADFFKCKWHLPTWPYIDPTKDSMADLTRVRNAMASMSHVQGENGMDWDEVFPKIVEEREAAIGAAIEAAARLNEKYNLQGAEKVSRRELMPLPQPEGVIAKLTGIDDSEAGTTDPAQTPGQAPEQRGQPVQTPRAPQKQTQKPPAKSFETNGRIH